MLKRHPWLSLPCSLVLIGLLLLPASAGAGDQAQIGRIIALRGAAEAVAADGSLRTLAMSAPLALGETVRTGQGCRLQIMFNDNTIISLGPQSELLIEEYQWEGGRSTDRMKSVVHEGVFRVLGGSITRSAPENFTTETPAATIGIRGSMYAGTVRDGALQVVFQGGKGIFVRNGLRSVEISIPGFGTRVSAPDAPPAEPYRVPASELEALDPLLAAAPAPDQERPATADGVEEPLAERPADATAAPEREGAAAEPAAGDETRLAVEVEAPPDTATRSAVPPLATVTDTASQTSREASSDLLQDRLTAATTGGLQSVSGRYLSVQDDLDLLSTSGDWVAAGSVSGRSEDGVLQLTVGTADGLRSIDPLTVNPYDASAVYSGISKLPGQMRTVDLLNQTVSFASVEVASDNTGQFAVMVLDDLFGTPTHAYRELGFAGVPSLAPPTTGIDRYRGPLLLTLEDVAGTEFESFSYNLGLMANWHSGKVFGIVEVPPPVPGDPAEVNGFFFGDLSGTGLANVRFVGMDIIGMETTFSDPALVGPGGGGMEMPLAISGATDFAAFYGREVQGVGLVASGRTYDVMRQTHEEDWRFTAAGFREVGAPMASLTGSVSWEGFAVGLGDDMTAPDVDRRIFMNTAPEDFSLILDRDNGTISGSYSASDRNNPGVGLTDLQIGGVLGSAYIADDLVAAVLGGAAPVVNGAAAGGLKTHGNYLISEDPEAPLARYASWGSWEVAYDDPASGQPYHVHHPGTYWVAGQRTSVSEVQGLIDSNFAASYSGKAAGVMIPPSGSFTDLSDGTCSLLLDFAPGATMPVSGSLDFAEISLPVGSAGGGLDRAGFSASVSSATQSALQGAFYGPAAGSIAGSFDALMSTGERYTGVFGGDR